MATTPRIGTHIVAALATTLAWTAPVLAAPSLDPATSAELQKLLAVQEGQVRVVYANHTPPRAPSSSFDRLFMWNEIALDTTAIDHTPVVAGETRKFGEELGPARTSRAMAIVHIALFEAINAITQKYQSYAGVAPVTGDVSADAAMAQSAHDTLVWLYPSQKPRLDEIYKIDLVRCHGSGVGVAAGKVLGATAALAIIARRTNDGSQIPEPIIGTGFMLHGGPGYWSPDPISNLKVALGAFWNQVTPFTMSSASQFRAPPPPALTDPAYTAAFQQVKALGGDPANGTATKRTPQQTIDGIYWTYDGTPAICAPARLYNQIARVVAFQQGMHDISDGARFLALINTAMGDAAISGWDTKYFYQFWRPITAIRSADQGGNLDVHPDPTWYALGAAATNTHGPNFTPPFPAYVSGHAVFGGALFEIFRKYWPDKTSFTFVSDEYNGHNTDIYGHIMKRHPLTFASFTDAEQANSESRIYIGVHWQFDADIGNTEGEQVADWTYTHAFQPIDQYQHAAPIR